MYIPEHELRRMDENHVISGYSADIVFEAFTFLDQQNLLDKFIETNYDEPKAENIKNWYAMRLKTEAVIQADIDAIKAALNKLTDKEKLLLRVPSSLSSTDTE